MLTTIVWAPKGRCQDVDDDDDDDDHADGRIVPGYDDDDNDDSQDAEVGGILVTEGVVFPLGQHTLGEQEAGGEELEEGEGFVRFIGYFLALAKYHGELVHLRY